MREAVIVSTARTGLAKSHRGGFNNTGGVAMAGHAIKHSIERAGIEPAEVEETPFFDIVWRHRRDASVDGHPLRIGGKTYRKGLGVHTRCRLVYALDGAYRSFITDVGIDDEVGDKGSADVRVLVDGKLKFERKALTGRAAPLRIELDVAGAKRLTLIADFGPQLDIADHVDWANARLIR